MDRNERIEHKLDSIREDVALIRVTNASQHEIIQILVSRMTTVEEAIEPLKKQNAMVAGVYKFIGLFGVLVGIIELFFRNKK